MLGVTLRAETGHGVRWRGQAYPLRFGDVLLELRDGFQVWRWPAVIGFSSAPLRCPLLGICGCLEFLDASFRGHDRMVDLHTNPSFPGAIT